MPPLAAVFLAASVFLLVQSVFAQNETCQPCHGAIVTSQSSTRMARTWLGSKPEILTPGQTVSKHEAGDAAAVDFSLSRSARGASRLSWRVELPGHPALEAPIEAALGGDRHGYSLLARVDSIEGVTLPSSALVETRYLLDPHRELTFSPGHPTDQPKSWETAVGRVLSPWFAERCAACHGKPEGIQCLHCHGSADAHVNSKGAILNPARLGNAAQIARCGQCHSDGRPLADPMPEDLLIASQADALTRSECYIQSGQGMNCSTCHNPHEDSRAGGSRYVNACLSCHDANAAKHAAVCPVNSTGNCIECHMPAQPKDSFRMVDHWIRVVETSAHQPNVRKSAPPQRSLAPPKRVFLRMILVPTREQADDIRAQLAKGAGFFEMARRYSKDPSAPSGGFLGEMWLDQMDARLARAASIDQGDISPVTQGPAGYVIFERLPRDFRWRADALFLEAAELKRKGQLKEALERNQQALEINPVFLRALLFLGISLGEQGDAQRAGSVLEFAASLYPNDTGAQLNVGIAYGASGRTAQEIQSYRRALDGEPDLVSAWLNLGAALLNEDRIDDAAGAYKKAIEANPLAAAAYYNLGVVYERQGRNEEARNLQAIAAKIDPQYAQVR